MAIQSNLKQFANFFSLEDSLNWQISPLLVYVATLPCKTLMSENKRLPINYEVVSVAICLRRGGG